MIQDVTLFVLLSLGFKTAMTLAKINPSPFFVPIFRAVQSLDLRGIFIDSPPEGFGRFLPLAQCNL